MRSNKKTGTQRASVPIGIGRAFGGALVFSLPMLMTMEMWELGFYMDRFRLAMLLLASFPMLMFLSHYSGFERTWGWKDDLRDVFLAYVVGIIASAGIMLVLGLLDLRMSWSEILGKTALQVVPAALGALLARSQLGQDSQDGHAEDGYGAELGVMAVGALFLSLNVAPTEEMVLIAYQMSAWHSLALICLSILAMHGFVYAAGFKGGGDLSEDDPLVEPGAPLHLGRVCTGPDHCIVLPMDLFEARWPVSGPGRGGDHRAGLSSLDRCCGRAAHFVGGGDVRKGQR